MWSSVRARSGERPAEAADGADRGGIRDGERGIPVDGVGATEAGPTPLWSDGGVETPSADGGALLRVSAVVPLDLELFSTVSDL